MDDNEKTTQLQEENRLLQEKLDGYKHLEQKITAYKSLEEELAAKRIYELAYKRIFSMLTAGGIIAVILTYFGYQKIVGYAESEAKRVASTMDSVKVMNTAKEVIDRNVMVLTRSQVEKSTNHFIDSIRPYLVSEITAQARSNTAPLNLTQSETSDTVIEANVTTPPPSVDLSKGLTVRDVGNEGSVVGFAIASAMEYQFLKQRNEKLQVSPRYIYNNIKLGKGDEGAFINDALNFVKKTGAIKESDWPYRAGEYNNPPPANVQNAVHYKIDRWQQIDISVTSLKKYLASGMTVIAGISVYAKDDDAAKTGILPVHVSNDLINGGHAILIIGYDDKTKLFKFLNSWGSSWGDRGYGYLHYEDLVRRTGQLYVIGKIL
jgi:C1A family cysteine protease